MISQLEDNDTRMAKSVDLLVAMRLIYNALQKVSTNVITNYYRKAMFKFNTRLTTEVELSADDNEEIWQKYIQLSHKDISFDSFANYVNIDENESTSGENDLSDEQIIQEVYGNECNSEITVESDEELIETKRVTNSKAFHHINELQKYFWQKGINSFDEELSKMQTKVTENTFNSLKQTKIVDFFN